MPDWNEKAHDIFLRATEIHNPDERAKFLAVHCGQDETLRRAVDDLFSADRKAGGFLDEAAAPLAETAVVGASPLGEGSVVGRYKLLQKLGEGGFGLVYMAQQTDALNRKVAIKLVKPGMDSQQLIARFEAERQALAMMEHPNIAKVLDADTTAAGHPYFVMELVKGRPIIEFCNREKLSVSERLQLFVPVCRAIQHAHQKGIVHRDIKPSNLLVSLYDGVPTPKVIDFGVAKALQQPLTEKTLFTQFGQVIGTLEYMSPEQAEFNQLDIDTRADIYALGAVLYELLAGTPPVHSDRLRARAFDEVLRIIREEEPPRPSIRLSSTGDADAISSDRNQTPERLSKIIGGDLDWIVMKAIEKDRNRRYQSASGFAADIQRYLDGAAVVARPPSFAYQLRKLVTRYRGPATAVGLVAVALVVGLLATSWGLRETSRAKNRVQGALHETSLAKAELQEAFRATSRAKNDVQRELYSSLLSRTEAAIRDDKLAEARRLLAACPPAYRGWEWSHLRTRSQRITVSKVPSSRIPFFTPDGERLLGPQGRRVVEWEVETGKELRTLKTLPEGQNIWRVFPSDDGRYCFLSIGFLQKEGNGLTCISLDDGAALWPMIETPKRVDKVRLYPDQSRFAALYDEGPEGFTKTTVFDFKTGEALFSLDPNRLQQMDVSPCGTFLATEQAVFDALTGDRMFPLESDGRPGFAVDISPDGKQILHGRFDGHLWIFDARTGRRVRDLAGHQGMIADAMFLPNSQQIVSSGFDTTVRLWDVPSGQQIGLVGEHDTQAWNVSVSPQGDRIASFSDFNRCLVWEANPANLVHTIHGDAPFFAGIAFLQDATRLVTKDTHCKIQVWDPQTGQELRAFMAHRDELHDFLGGVLPHPNGKWVLTEDRVGQAVLHDIDTGEVVRRFEHGRDALHRLMVSFDGTMVATRNHEGLKIWDLESGTPLTLNDRSQTANHMAFSADDNYLATSSFSDARVRIWNPRSGELLHELGDQISFVNGLGFSAADAEPQLVCLGQDSTVQIWDPKTGKRIKKLQGRASFPMIVFFGHQNTRIFLSSLDATVSIWDAIHGKELFAWVPHDDAFSAWLSPDQKTVVTPSQDKTIKFWESEPPTAEVARRRRLVAQGRRILLAKQQELIFVQDVQEALAGDASLTGELRELVLEMAAIRINNPHTLHERSRATLAQAGRTRVEYERALRMARFAAEEVADAPRYAVNLALAHARVGDPEQALAQVAAARSLAAATTSPLSLDDRYCLAAITLDAALQTAREAQAAEARSELQEMEDLVQPISRWVRDLKVPPDSKSVAN